MKKPKFNDLAQEWERMGLRQNRSPRPPSPVEHATTGPKFVEQLIRMAEVTGDPQFNAAKAAIEEHLLLGENGEWIPEWQPKDRVQDLAELSTIECNYIAWMMSEGHALRYSCVFCAVELAIIGVSLEAVIARLERKWRALTDEEREFLASKKPAWFREHLQPRLQELSPENLDRRLQSEIQVRD